VQRRLFLSVCPLLVIMLLAPAGAYAQRISLEVERDTVYYAVFGEDRAEIYHWLRKSGPQVNGTRAAALLNYAIGWDVEYGGFNEGNYTIRSGRVKLQMTWTFPFWTSYDKTDDPSLKSQWDDFYKSLERHEDGHKKIVLEHAGRLVDLLKDYTESDKARFSQILEEKANAIIDACERENSAYDNDTSYGKEQGGIWLIK